MKIFIVFNYNILTIISTYPGEADYLEHLEVDGRMILKQIPEKQAARIWIGLILTRIYICGGLLKTRQ
jgi:hypothetical protein